MKTALLDMTSFHVAPAAAVVGVTVSRGPVVLFAGTVPAPTRRR